jgi:hypothetical protein
MAWRNTNPSDYAPKSNAIGEALTGFASVYAPAKIAKDKREAEIAYEKEKADAKAAADAAEKAAAKDAQDKKDAKIVSIILREQNLDPTKVKPDVRIDILKDVQIMGKDAISYYSDPNKQFSPEFVYKVAPAVITENLVDNGVNNVIQKDDTAAALDDNSIESTLDTETETVFPTTDTENAPVGGEDKEPVSRYQSVAITTKEIVDLGEAGRVAALKDATVSAEDKKRITNWQTANQSILDKEAQIIPYADITADNYIQIAAGFENNTQLQNGKELAKKVTELGEVLVKSLKKPLTLVEVNQLDLSILEGSIEAGGLEEAQAKLFNQVIDSKYNEMGRELSKLDDTGLQGTRDNPFETTEMQKAADAILKGRKEDFDIKDWDNIKGATLDVAIATAKGQMKSQLESLKKARANVPAEIELDTSAGFLISTYQDENGDTIIATTAPTKNGQLFDIDRQRVVPTTNNVSSVAIKTLQAQAQTVSQMNDKVLVPLTESRREMATMLQSAEKLESFIDPSKGGSAEILTTVGGDMQRLIKRFDNEYKALNSMYLQGKTDDEVFSYIDNVSVGKDGVASKASQFEAELLKYAYLYATVSLEQRGAGLSNTDFKNALQIVGTGSDYTTFSNNLRSRSLEGIEKVRGRVNDLVETSAQIKILDQLDPSKNLSSGYTQSVEQYLEGRGLSHLVEYATTKATVQKDLPGDGENNSSKITPTIGQALSTYKNAPIYAQNLDAYSGILGSLGEAEANKYLDILSKTYNIPVDVLRKEFGTQE